MNWFKGFFIGRDMNGHVGKDSWGFERVHGNKGYWVRNELDAILILMLAYNLI